MLCNLKTNAGFNKAIIGPASNPNCKYLERQSLLKGASFSSYFDRELRLELNVCEKSAWDLTYPAFFPSPPEGLKSEGEAVWYFYLAEIALRRLGNRILNYTYQYDSSTNSESNFEDAIHDFEEQADGWCVVLNYFTLNIPAKSL